MKSRTLVQSKNTSRRLGSPREVPGTPPSAGDVQLAGWVSSAGKEDRLDVHPTSARRAYDRQNR